MGNCEMWSSFLSLTLSYKVAWSDEGHTTFALSQKTDLAELFQVVRGAC